MIFRHSCQYPGLKGTLYWHEIIGAEASLSYWVQLINNKTHVNPGPHVIQSQHKDIFKENTKMTPEVLKNSISVGFSYKVLCWCFTQKSSQSTLLSRLIVLQLQHRLNTNTHTHSFSLPRSPSPCHTYARVCMHTHAPTPPLNPITPPFTAIALHLYTTLSTLTAPHRHKSLGSTILLPIWLLFSKSSDSYSLFHYSNTRYLSVWLLQHHSFNNKKRLSFPLYNIWVPYT